MIIAVGSFFWILALAAVYRLLRIGSRQPRRQLLELAVLLICAIPLLFRPHEDIFGGQDPGSYINSGITYDRNHQLFFIDELLAKIPQQNRTNFYYGHAEYGQTKDACLWIRNAELGMVGPHFQPAYPLLIAVASHLGNSWCALFVVPIFTLFTALALRILAQLTIPHARAGLIAFTLFIFNPLTIWHGRCARPEIIASFMFFGGLALVAHAWQNQNWKKPADLIIGALCIGFSPLFHITAWALVIPVGVAAMVATLKGRDDFLLYDLIAVLTAGVFYLETIHVTDYYTVRRFFEIPFSHPWIIVFAFVLLSLVSVRVKLRTGAATAVPVSGGGAPLPDSDRQQNIRSLCAGLLLCAIIIAFLAILAFNRKIFGDLPVLGKPVQDYLYLTDFKVAANMLSLPIMLLALAGFIIWMTGRCEKRPLRILLTIVLLPSLMLAGNISDFMMTRYLMVSIVPAIILCLTALIAFLTPREKFWRVLILTAIICALGLHGRTHLVATVEHKGFCRFLRPYAETIRANKGMLLCEYSRNAAPMEHFFGIPTLGLDNERRNNYEPVEKAWANIMKAMPERAAFFMTPYHAPISEYFDFEQIYSGSFDDCLLEQARQSLPTIVGRSDLGLRLFRMKLKEKAAASNDFDMTPVVIELDAGNMGLRKFANVRFEPFSVTEKNSGAADLSELPEKTRNKALTLMEFPDQEKTPVKNRGKIQVRWSRAGSEVLLPLSGKTATLLMIHLRAPNPDGTGFVSLQLTGGDENLGKKRKIKSEQWQWQVWRLPRRQTGSDVEWITLNVDPPWNPGKSNFPTDLGVLVSKIVVLPIE